MLGESLQLNIYNASTFACDALLHEYPLRPKGELVRYYQSGPEPKVKAPKTPVKS